MPPPPLPPTVGRKTPPAAVLPLSSPDGSDNKDEHQSKSSIHIHSFSVTYPQWVSVKHHRLPYYCCHHPMVQRGKMNTKVSQVFIFISSPLPPMGERKTPSAAVLPLSSPDGSVKYSYSFLLRYPQWLGVKY